MTADILRDQNAHALIIVRRGRKWLRALALYSPPVRIVKFERSAERDFRPLLYKGAQYPLKRAIKHFRRAGRDMGITKGAAAILKELSA